MKIAKWVLIVLLMAGCASPNQLVKNQHYDRAIEKLSKKMRTGKASEKNVKLLTQAYHSANQRDHDQIMLLRQSGQPDIWADVYYRYTAMNNRQDIIKSLAVETQQRISFRPVSYGADIADAKAKASAYYYARAEQLLQSDDRADARRAYDLLVELSQFNRNYRDTESLMHQAILRGTNQVLFSFDNQTGMPLPEGFVNNLMQFNPADFQDDFVNFDVVAVNGKFYDYTIWISLLNIQVSPERSESRSFTETKEVLDGTKPKRDNDGNIMLDSTGKVIEIPNYRSISARVDETLLSKSALLEATLDFENNSSERVVFSIPVSATSHFNHAFAFVNGDMNAISRETRQMVQNKPIPFPPDGILLIEASRVLNQAVKRSIRKESSRLKRTD